MKERYCKSCGCYIPRDEKSCLACGKIYFEEKTAAAPKSKTSEGNRAADNKGDSNARMKEAFEKYKKESERTKNGN